MAASKKASNKVSTETNAKEIKALKEHISQLEHSNKDLKEKVNMQHSNKKPKSFLGFLRNAGVIFFVTLSIVTFMLFNITSWVKATLLDTDTFVETTRPLIEQPAVQKTLQEEITSAIFENINVEEELSNALPENVAFLAGPLAGQVESFTYDKVGEVLESEQLEGLWVTTLETVQKTLLEYITNDQSDGVININDLYGYASDQLQDTQIAFLLNKQLPDSVGQITLIELPYFDEVKSTVNFVDKLPIVLLITSALSFIMALLLAINMRKVITVTVILSFIMTAATLLAIYIMGIITANQANPEYADAVKEIYVVITDPLIIRTQGYLALLGVVLAIMLITSKVGFVTKSATYLNKLSINTMKKYVPKFDVPSWLEWTITSNKVLCWTIFYTLLVVIGLRVPPNADQVITAFIIASVTSLIIYLATLVLTTAKSKTK